MKFIIYWALHTSSFGNAEISGVISINDSTVTSYVLDYGYVTWNILEKKQTVGDTRLSYAHYYLERNHIKSYLVINQRSIYQYIATEPPLHIKLTRKDEYRR